MPSAARAARSEQTAQTPPLRRKPCDPEQSTILPRDPSQDLAIKGQLRATLGAMLARTHGRNRHLVWARNGKLQKWTALKRSTLDDHLRKLEAAGRIRWLKTRAEVDQFFLESARFGPRYAQRPSAMPPDYERLIVLLAWLPPVLYPDAYGPLGLKVPPQDAPPGDTGHLGAPSPGNRAQPTQDFGRPIEKENSPEGETQMKPSSPTPESEAATETTTICLSAPGEEETPEWVAEGLGMSEGHPARARAERYLRCVAARAGGNQPNPSRPTSFVESPAAGHGGKSWLPRVAPATPSAGGSSPGGVGSSEGRIGREALAEARAIVEQVHRTQSGAWQAGERLARVMGDPKPDTEATYAKGLAAMLAGQVAVEAVLADLDAIDASARRIPPAHMLSERMAGYRRMEKPAAGASRQSFPGGGPQPNVSASPHCTVVK